MSTYPRTRAVELDDATAGQPTDAERHVEREGAGRNRLDVHVQVLAHAHDRALAELLLDLAECGVEGLLTVVGCHCCLLVFRHRRNAMSLL